MAKQYDLVIVGGGMVGATVAAAIGHAGFRVALIEAGEIPKVNPQDEYDVRVSAITTASRRIFSALGAWEGMEQLRVSPFRHMHVWDSRGSGEIHFDSADIGADSLGYIVENRVIQCALWQKLEQMDTVDLVTDAHMQKFDITVDRVQVYLDDESRLDAPLLVGADGGRSNVRQLAGIQTKGWAYDQHAVVATVKPEQDHQETAWQRFLANGPLAFLPLNDGLCSIVWSTRPEHASELVQMEEGEFRAQLAEALEYRLGEITACGPRASYPLRLQHAARYVKPRLALVGDAAHTIHPLAGQGVNLGLLDAAVLADVIQLGRQKKQDIGSYELLRKYERWRKGDNLGMMFAMDGFKRLFGNDWAPVRLLRNLGLKITDSLPPVKNRIIENAMGLRGELPSLARPSVSSHHQQAYK